MQCVKLCNHIPCVCVHVHVRVVVQDKMVQQLGRDPSTRLLKHVVRCYLRLSDNLRYVEA